MMIENQEDVTKAVLAELDRSSDERFKEIMSIAVKYLHAFVREAKLTEPEYHQACGIIAKLGQLTTPSHNEVVLSGGSLGVSALVCLLNNGNKGQDKTTANLMGPFWRGDQPIMPNGANLVRSEMPGLPIFVDAYIKDQQGHPVSDARVDVWHCSTEGYYENQDPDQADMNLRASFKTNADGHIWFRSVKPVGYPIPVSGPVGDLLRKQGRHNMRPAHIHFMINKEGYKTQFSQVYSNDDPYLETDVQFGVTKALVAQYVLHNEHDQHEKAPDSDVKGPWYSMEHHFVIEPGSHALPVPPIKSKSDTARPELVVLKRS